MESNITTDDLVTRLTVIRERLFWLQATWAVTLSPDVALETDRYLTLFRDLADELRKTNPDAVDKLIAGHEALLLAEPLPRKPSLPAVTQEWFELTGEVRNARRPAARPKPQGYVSDGLQQFL